MRCRAALLAALTVLAAVPRAGAQVPAENRVHCQLLSFRVHARDQRPRAVFALKAASYG